ncbi:hypothetical protein G7085_12375 [Tessaracoccus sp. HDW20]|uniref:Stealth CR1 domain-containing protein n=1 Tax=Tessaracoccus coleopterorum TaxID=2714950 RepID=UPI0018D29F11|nr:Stealth CR1 domain-containing protein [Tessaracoccus coleopterorum]NHB85144.1 hypothetical protein [Tessaracoccus coleopterorum]
MSRASATAPALVFRAWANQAGRFAAGPDVGVVVTTGPLGEPEPEFDIDLVFTWVDGGDPAWQARRQGRDTSGALHPTATNDARFTQIDELRYALRAVERFAPWRRRVFLVTDRQRPAWLADEFPHVTVVDHTEIFDDPEALPTFNSHAIESRLHHIPGLAEHWVYLNDDVFLARYTPPSTFFTSDGRLRAFLARDPIAEPTRQPDEPVVAASRNNSAVLERLTGVRVRHKMKHVPHPQLRSLTLELESLAAEEFHRTQLAPFRQPTDLSVASSLAPHYALATGRGVPGR